MLFGIPMVWSEGKDHITDAYFYMTNLKSINCKNSTMFNTLMFIVWQHHFLMVQTSVPKPNVTMESSFDSKSSDMTDTAECGAYRPEKDDQTVPLTQAALHELTRDLNLSKESAQLLGSHLREKRLLAPGTTFYWYREHAREFLYLFTFDGASSLVYYNNIADLTELLGLKYDSMKWRLFIDSSNSSLIAVLLNNRNKFSSIPVSIMSDKSDHQNND